MLPWNQRPFEIVYLLNPAFCSILIRETVDAFTDERQQGLPYPLAFLVLPIVLHHHTRSSLPERANFRMFDWLERHPQAKSGFANRSRRLVPYAREAIIFGMQKGILTIDELGNLISIGTPTQPTSWPDISEPSICRDQARFLGRWFAQLGDAAMIFRLWGIRP